MLRDVHRLASRYHWGEGELLSLPLPRRLAYLGLIDAEESQRLLSSLEQEG